MLNRLRYIAFAVLLLASCSISQEAYHTNENLPPQQLSAKPGSEYLEADKTSGFRPNDNVPAFKCTEDTNANFNTLGIEALPFLRIAFYDIDRDGLFDLIGGSKDGSLHLYRNSGSSNGTDWQSKPGYFKGIRAGAFSAPAVGDLDGDGKAEIAVGTGGFSSDSGHLLFFRNSGTDTAPEWTRIKGLKISFGNDASATFVDYNLDGKLDIIAGNSEGRIFFLQNVSTDDMIRFRQDASPLDKRSFGMYAVPAAVKIKNTIFLIIGNSVGRLYLFEIRKNSHNIYAIERQMPLSAKSFAAPAFAELREKGRFDLVFADGDGFLSYFENTRRDFSIFKETREMFSSRILAGPACAPVISRLKDKTCMVIGNIDGALSLYDFTKQESGLPWVERKGYLEGIRLSGFSRAVLTFWDNEEILVAGQENGRIRAFLNRGSNETPLWKEEKKFFSGIHIGQHSTPTVFDLDGDGVWELITGAADGKVYAFRAAKPQGSLPVWEKIEGIFDNIKSAGFSAPSVTLSRDNIYLLVGQQDGSIKTYVSEFSGLSKGRPFDFSKIKFTETSYLSSVQMNSNSSPSVIARGEDIEIASGDYNGNLRHFSCSPATLRSN